MAKKPPKTDKYGRPVGSIHDPAIDDAIVNDRRERKPVSLDYLVEVAAGYLETFERIENAQRQQYDRETIHFLKQRQKTLGDELRRLRESGDGHVGGVEHGAEWKKLRSMGGPPETVAREIVKRLGGATVSKEKTPAATRQSEPTVRIGKVDLALGVLVAHPEWSVKRIAEEIDCHPKHLSGSDRFKQARAALRAGKERLPRGNKNAETGKLEAWKE